MMGTETLIKEISRLVGLLDRGDPIALGAIPWAAPVVSFGNPVTSTLATLGLNPSNLEFVDNNGNPLLEPYNRFESLKSLRATSWGEMAKREASQIWRACETYFYRNPYDQWFMRLEKLLVETGISYYTSLGKTACHLDLVPFATADKWSAIGSRERTQLIELGAPSLVQAIRSSNIRTLVLNGSTVVKEFSRLLDADCLEPRAMKSWALQSGRVDGYAYVGRITKLHGAALGREILVLGYNHNIQSSFGVTREVVARIGSWIARSSEEVFA